MTKLCIFEYALFLSGQKTLKPRSHQIAEAVTSLGEKVENRPYLQALRDHLNWLKSISIQSPEIFAGPILMQKRSLNLKKWVSRPENN